jgi:hypothetical protein
MRTTWASWDLDDMQDRADEEGHVGLDVLRVPVRDFLTTLPYYGAFAEYRDHIVGCAECREDSRTDCARGETLRTVARVGLEEQARIAESN